MKYIFSVEKQHDRFISVSIEVAVAGSEYTDLQLPSWRPGRYEAGNFAKNIKQFYAFADDGTRLTFKKIKKDLWRINNAGQPFTVKYKYYASQPDAGGCFVDDDILYVNPVHCCMFIPGQESDPCSVQLETPVTWQVATGLKKEGANVFSAADFDRLADSPFIASPSLQHRSYESAGVNFNIWLSGNCKPDWERIVNDFKNFTDVQFKMMLTFPTVDYHFLVLLLPNSFYHGVEHLNSTVLALGPGYNLMKPSMYNEFLGVASHELFHSWNVKSIRPAEMLPYDFTAENYAETGYVYEGVTTYYGDLFLARSGFFTLQQLLDEYSKRFQKHMDNPGRLNYSVSESSFDTWLDGYTPGVPGRKSSIYDEGCLLALMLDFMIRSATVSEKSLDDVMRALYNEIALSGKGYTAESYRSIAERIAERSFTDFFDNYVNKAVSYDTILTEVLSLAGLQISETESAYMQERYYGFKTEYKNGSVNVTATCPGSPAYMAGLLKDDEILAVNNIRAENNLSELISLNAGAKTTLIVSSSRRIKTIILEASPSAYYSKYRITSEEVLTMAQLAFRQSWLRQD
jgi:predicted metalloprotease with PDZ domain